MSLPHDPLRPSRIPDEKVAAEIVEAYAVALSARRLAPSTITRYRQVAEHFAAWCDADHHIDLASVRPAHVDAFLSAHLSHCACAHGGRRAIAECRAALRHLLRTIGAPAGPTRAITAVDEEVARYERYLSEVCGAADQTRVHRIRHVRAFLTSLFGVGPVSDDALRPTRFADFLTARAQGCRPGTAGVISNDLRSYVRYLQLHGRCADDVGAGIPTVARWRLANVPVHLQPSEVKRFLHSFDRQTVRGRRDYAMALCLTVLGLRASEVADVRLADVDWRAGTLTVRAGKTHRARVLPVTVQVGRALVSYVRVRPRTPHNHLFVRIGVLEGEPVLPSVVRSAIRLAYHRAGLPADYTGTHRLRHTAATGLIRAGASIKEVADVLGHASVDSTAIYTKLDLPRLRRVALPWVEVTR